jgi:hypothetical protein
LDSTKESKGLELDKSHKVDRDFNGGDVENEVELGFTDRSKKKAKLLKHVWVILKHWDFQELMLDNFCSRLWAMDSYFNNTNFWG